MAVASDHRRAAFVRGCASSAPVVVSFLLMFSSFGALALEKGVSTWHATAMTLLVFAAPLQLFMVQNLHVSAVAIAVAAVITNFRFFIMASALHVRFGRISLWKIFLSSIVLSASTFAVSKGQTSDSEEDALYYYLGVGIMGLGSAFAGTLIGSLLLSLVDSQWLKVLAGIIMPLHFTALTALQWPALKPILMTALGFLLTPIAMHWFGSWQAIVLPLGLAAIFVACETGFEKQGRRR
ncbi:AzlC family ABC transporter permease [Verminephrobacter aporrectodeae]|nr:AzlC family ABC transporter permease [Verminephrobacter aporrectodeae]